MRWLKQTLFPAAVNNTHRELLPRHWWQEDVNSIYQVNGKHYAAKSERSRFSRASLTGIFSHTAVGRPCWGRAARALGSAGGAALAEQRSRAGGTEPGRMCSDSPGVGARDQRPGNTSSKELALKGLGRSQHVAVCIRPHRWTLRLERY